MLYRKWIKSWEMFEIGMSELKREILHGHIETQNTH